jgi:hypothetical protein
MEATLSTKEKNEAFDREYGSVLDRLLKGEITAYEYCKMADDIMIAYTTIRWPLHLLESYARLPPLSPKEDKEDEEWWEDEFIKEEGVK